MARADRGPKKIAGLKLPKAIRQAPAIRSLLATPAGRKILNDALIAGAAAAAQHVMEAHEAAKSKAKVKLGRAGKAEDTAEVAAAGPVGEPAAAVKTPKPTSRRSKATKPAPDAAPVDDVVPSAAEELIPAEESQSAIEPDFDAEDPVKPSAAD